MRLGQSCVKLGFWTMRLWGCFEDATNSFIGYFAVAHETELKFFPQNNPMYNLTQH